MSFDKFAPSLSKNGMKILSRRVESKSPSPLLKRISNDNDSLKNNNELTNGKKRIHESRIDAFLREKQIVDPKKILVENLIARNFRVMKLRQFIRNETGKTKKSFIDDYKKE